MEVREEGGGGGGGEEIGFGIGLELIEEEPSEIASGFPEGREEGMTDEGGDLVIGEGVEISEEFGATIDLLWGGDFGIELVGGFEEEEVEIGVWGEGAEEGDVDGWEAGDAEDGDAFGDEVSGDGAEAKGFEIGLGEGGEEGLGVGEVAPEDGLPVEVLARLPAEEEFGSIGEVAIESGGDAAGDLEGFEGGVIA